MYSVPKDTPAFVAVETINSQRKFQICSIFTHSVLKTSSFHIKRNEKEYFSFDFIGFNVSQMKCLWDLDNKDLFGHRLPIYNIYATLNLNWCDFNASLSHSLIFFAFSFILIPHDDGRWMRIIIVHIYTDNGTERAAIAFFTVCGFTIAVVSIHIS